MVELYISWYAKEINRKDKITWQNKTSLSKMIEAYFDSLTNEEDDINHIKTTPLVESLCGVIELPEDFDYKKSKAEYLIEK